MNHVIASLLALAASSPSTQNSAPDPRRLEIELLYLDLTTCTRCVDTGARLDEALSLLAPVLKETGWVAEVKKIHVATEAQARELRFASSPTVRINGRDVQLESRESVCVECGKLRDATSVTCREWRYRDGWFTSPPRALFVEVVLQAMYAPTPVAGAKPAGARKEPPFEAPENLKRFFAAEKEAKKSAGCRSPGGASEKGACVESRSVTPKKGCCEAAE